MRHDRTWVVARHEWLTTVLRREFLLATFGLPLMFLFFGGISAVGGFFAASKALRGADTAKPVAIYDPAHILAPAAFVKPLGDTRYQLTARRDSGEREVISGRLRALLVVAPDYVQSGAFTVYRKAGSGLFGDAAAEASRQTYAVALRAGLVWGRVPPAVAHRVAAAPDKAAQTVYEWDPKRRTFQKPDPLQQAAQFFVPYLFSLLLLMSIFIGTGYLLHGIVEEKENRVMEMLLSSVPHEQILRGKLLGLGGAGLTQMAVWVLMGGIPALLILAHLPTSLRLSPVTLLIAVVLFMLGFALYGSVMAGIGSLGTSWRESQQVTGAVVVFAVIPLMLLVPILDAPNGVIARVLSWFPPTAPITLMLRTAVGTVPLWDLALGIGLLLVAIWAVQKISAKIFRLGLLLYGKVPTPVEVFRWLRTA